MGRLSEALTTGSVKVNYGTLDNDDKDSESESTSREEHEKVEEKTPMVGFCSLFRFASGFDICLIILAIIIAVASGASMPAVMIIFGKMIDKFSAFDRDLVILKVNCTNETWDCYQNITALKNNFGQETALLCLYNTLFGVAFLVCNYLYVSMFCLTAANQAFRIRCKFMSSVLKQEVGWYDTNETGDFASRITGDLKRIEDGIGDKVGMCISFLASTVFCIVVGMSYGWKLALVILSLTPVLTIAMAIMSKVQAAVSMEEFQAYGTAGAVAEEVLSSIRTVVAFGGERKEIGRYESFLAPARKKGIKRGLLTSIGAGITWLCIFAGYALAFWYGVKLIVEGRGQENPQYTGGTLIIVFFNVMSASMFIGQTAPYFEAFNLARGAAAKIYDIIDRKSQIDSSSDCGVKPESLAGRISLRDVYFSYPSRKSVPVLSGLSLSVESGERIALVGPSGCGKSTIIQLILRFYDACKGSVEVDEYNVNDLNVGWLRDSMSLVGQEPVLFSTTIEENIRHGKPDASLEEVENAAKLANVHGFIETLPLKYKTLVGERGTQLSGGQKQRIAIARAIIKNPQILLLDEATSALDTESESVVQAALDEASLGRTTIVVAHRLSTVKNADRIIVLKDGTVQEIGTHHELMKRKGIYHDLVLTQTKEVDEEEEVLGDLIDPKKVLERQTSVLSYESYSSDDLSHRHERRGSSHETFQHQISIRSSCRRKSSILSGYDFHTSTTIYQKEPFDTVIDDDEKNNTPSQTRLLKTASSEWPYIVIGAIAAMLMGVHYPLFGILFGEILGGLNKEGEQLNKDTAFFCLLFLLMGITSFVCSFLQVFMFTLAGEKLTSRLRKMVFANIITQDISFFDDPKNSVGSLCSRLTSDASNVQGAAGSRISTIVQAISTMIVSITIGLIYNYKIGLVVLSFTPLVLLAAYCEGRVISGHMLDEKAGTEEATKIAIEAIESIRTVAALHQENAFYQKFRSCLLVPHIKSRFKAHVRGLMFGFAQAVQTFAYSTALYYGSRLVEDEELSFANLLKVLEGVIVGIMMVGQSLAFAPDYQKAKVSAGRIFRLLDLKPKVDVFSTNGLVLNDIKGHIQFRKVHFNYPSRPDIRILKGLNLDIEPGKTIALVGSSGCGKSTCVQLIERFYDAERGEVLLDDVNVTEVNVSNLRSHLGLVSQEPVLFSYSIAENIAYGDNTRNPGMNEVMEAARQANIHNFISTLPQGYDTPVGDKGAQLSGGQKQRVAIARALLRNPKILLLDEATSALDAESEKVVQEALDKARSGRTCLIIAHRLTTIQNADTIIVIHNGKVVEKGTHQELLNKKGYYYKLHHTQA